MTRSGRPQAGEFDDSAADDIASVPGDDAVAAMRDMGKRIASLIGSLRDDRVAGIAYAPGKWTLKEVLGHLIDDERIMAYRALAVCRREPLPLPGIDEKLYVTTAGFEQRTLVSLHREYTAGRESSIAFFEALTDEQWRRSGNVNGYDASVRGLAFQIASHELHHLRIIEAKYLPMITSSR